MDGKGTIGGGEWPGKVGESGNGLSLCRQTPKIPMGLYLQLCPPPFILQSSQYLSYLVVTVKLPIIFASTQLLQSLQSLLYFVVCV